MANKKIDNKINEELVNVFIPKQSRNDTERFVAVNGRTFMVPKGKDVKVPLPVYEVLMNARMAEEEAFRRAQADN